MLVMRLNLDSTFHVESFKNHRGRCSMWEAHEKSSSDELEHMKLFKAL